MMRALYASIWVLAFAAQVGAVAAQPTMDDGQAKAAKPDADVLAFYPAQDRAKGVEGAATINCHSSPHGAARDCTLISESPQGDGFGDAALRVAAASVDRAGLDLPPDKAELPRTITLVFKLSPPSIRPNLLNPSHSIEAPRWLRRPSADDVASAYPERAWRAGIEGSATMVCVVTRAGGMRDCAVTDQAPEGAGFGPAELKLARFFRMTPTTDLGFSVEGAKVTIPVIFR
jgi:TonB family protein